ncbi:hypothetical protein RclHR1_08280008 [Rhizophagus clarus]|nr:hypothetical protein RclHR1_08280008 [Rhizophagus clarus]
MSQEVSRGRRSDDDVEMILNTDQETTETFTIRTDTLYSIEDVDNLCHEKVQEAKTTAEKSKKMIEDDRKGKLDKISQLRTDLINTINDANNKINKIYEELKNM